MRSFPQPRWHPARLDNLDSSAAVSTQFRRFESIAFDQYGYFSQSIWLAVDDIDNGRRQQPDHLHGRNAQPNYGGSLFVSDLASGLYVTVTPVAPLADDAHHRPGAGPGIIGVTIDCTGSGVVIPIVTGGNTHRQQSIRRPDPPRLAQRHGEYVRLWIRHQRGPGLHELRQLDADHQLLGGRDDALRFRRRCGSGNSRRRPTWPSSTSGTLVGLNDLRTLGVPYDGQNSAVAVVDTGVDAEVPPFRGRVAPGTDIFTGGLGNQDLATFATSSTTGGTGGGGGGTGGGAGGTGGGNGAVGIRLNGHGTPVAGIIAQFVPQATIVPVNIFVPFIAGLVDLRLVDRRRRRRRWNRRRNRRRYERIDLALRHHQCPDLDRSALQRLAICDHSPLRQRPASPRQGRSRHRGLVRLRYDQDVPERSRRLQELSRRS